MIKIVLGNCIPFLCFYVYYVLIIFRQRQEAPARSQLRALRNQLEDAEAARAAACKARAQLDAEAREAQQALEEATRARTEAEQRLAQATRERAELRGQLDENEEELAEVNDGC